MRAGSDEAALVVVDPLFFSSPYRLSISIIRVDNYADKLRFLKLRTLAMRTASNLTALEHIGSARNAFADLEHWLYSHTSTTHKLHSIEVEQERRGREVLRLMLQANIDSRGDGCVGDGLVVNPQGSSEEIVYCHKRLRSRRLITHFGTVSVARMEHCSLGQHSLHPLDVVQP